MDKSINVSVYRANNRDLIKREFIAVFLVAQVSFAQSVYAERAFVDVEYPVVDTGIIQKNEPIKVGVWLDDNRIIINEQSYRKKANGEYIEEQKSVLYDVLNNKKKILTELGHIRCYNPEQYLAGVRLNKIDQIVSLNFDGSMTLLKEQPKNISPIFCRSDVTIPFKAIKLLREQDGYIDVSSDGKEGYVSQPAILHSPNQPPKSLHINGGDIGYLQYFPFLNKYLLNRSDTRRLKTYDPSGTYQQKQPFRLMSPDGEITIIPFPEKFVSTVLKGQFFGYVIPVKTGLIVVRGGYKFNNGLFLLQGDKVARIWGKNDDSIFSETVSPDGCRLAFVSCRETWHGQTSKTVKILNLCTQGATP